MNMLNPQTERFGNWMQTYTGRQFWPLDPRPDDICIEDIAHALSMQTRYGGHCKRFYSVAEHSVLLSQSVAEPFKKWALLHDAAEAYLQDVIRPIKPYLNGYKTWELRLMNAIATRFDMGVWEPLPVKEADNRILLDEQAQNMSMPPAAWSAVEGLEPLGVTLQFWSPTIAESHFLLAFQDL